VLGGADGLCQKAAKFIEDGRLSVGFVGDCPADPLSFDDAGLAQAAKLTLHGTLSGASSPYDFPQVKRLVGFNEQESQDVPARLAEQSRRQSICCCPHFGFDCIQIGCSGQSKANLAFPEISGPRLHGWAAKSPDTGHSGRFRRSATALSDAAGSKAIENLPTIEVMQQPIVAPSARALARDDRRPPQLRPQLAVRQCSRLQPAPSTADGRRREQKVHPRVLAAAALNGEFAHVRGHRDSHHEGRDRVHVNPTRSLWLDLKTKSLHAG
jgi:hypothetical protein